MNHKERYSDFAKKYLGRVLETGDGINETHVHDAEKNIGLRLPESLCDYYRVAGAVEELNRIHNHLRDIDEIEIEGDYVIFSVLKHNERTRVRM